MWKGLVAAFAVLLGVTAAAAQETKSRPFGVCPGCSVMESLARTEADVVDKGAVSRAFSEGLSKETLQSAISGRVTVEDGKRILFVELYGEKTAIARAVRRLDDTFRIDPLDGPAFPLALWSVDTKITWPAGTKSVLVYTPSEAPIEGTREDGTLIARCRDNKTELLILWPSPLDPEDGRAIQWRLDGRPIVTEPWGTSDVRPSLFSPRPIPMLTEMLNAREFTIRVRGTSQSATFSLAGLGEALKPLREACGW